MFTLHPKLVADSWYLADFSLCALLLAKDANYPWLILVPRVPAIEEIYQLSLEQREQLMDESCTLAEQLQHAFNADKLNIAALGNVVPQLHLHHIARMHGDAAWPGPIWGVKPAIAYRAEALRDTLERLRAALPAGRLQWRAAPTLE